MADSQSNSPSDPAAAAGAAVQEDDDDASAAAAAAGAAAKAAANGQQEEQEDEEEEEEDEEEAAERKRSRMLGFMFGNVDDSGDLDEEYLDQDAKEHLSALADQLGPAFLDLELSSKLKRSAAASVEAEEQEDYDKKADDAVDYEDIQEQYEGPEVQMLPHDEQFYAQAALAGPSLKLGAFIPEEDNYDEEDDYDRLEELPEKREQLSGTSVAEVSMSPPTENEALLLKPSTLLVAVQQDEQSPIVDAIFPDQDASPTGKAQSEDVKGLKLPVLCEEDGKEVLRFSELFGLKEPIWLVGSKKLRHIRPFPKEFFHKSGSSIVAVEEDEEESLKSGLQSNPGAQSLCSPRIQKAQRVHSQKEQLVEEMGGEFVVSFPPSVGYTDKLTTEYPMSSHLLESENFQETLSFWLSHLPPSNFDTIHQQEWESKILWDTGDLYTKASNYMQADRDSSTSISDIDLDIVHTAKESNFKSSSPISSSVTAMHIRGNIDAPIVLESLSKPEERKGDLSFLGNISRHPQMLRLESLSLSHTPSKKCQLEHEDKQTSEVVSQLQLLSLDLSRRNVELEEEHWLKQVIWDEADPGTRGCQPKVIFDLKDPHMVFEMRDIKQVNALQTKSVATILTSQGKKSGTSDSPDSFTNLSSVARYNFSNDKFYTVKKSNQQVKSQAKKRAIHGIKVIHSLPAIKLQTMKPKLTNKDLANFHRPKAVWFPHHNEVAAKEQGKLAAEGSMKVILKTLGGKRTKLHMDASESLNALREKAAKKLGDLKPLEKTKVIYCGKELINGRTFAEQEVPPNSILHLVRTKVHPWPRAQRLPGENKPMRPPGAFKKKSELSVKDGHVALMEYCEERPLLLGNVGMGARLSTYYRKLTSTDSTAATLRNDRGSWVGVPLPLEPAEESPFLGNIRAGDTQSCLETNMYRAPAFHRKVASTDFLLVRSAKGKLSLRRIDSIHVVGQQEPHMEVIAPSSKSVLTYLGNRLLVYMYREFRSNEKPGSSPRVRADEVTAQFPSLTDGFIRKRLKHCAFYQRLSEGDMWWVMRRNFRVPSEEELRRMVTPENVCAYESMQAGLHHLKRIGVHKLTQASGLSAAMNQLPDEAITLAAASHIERELQITPWNLSSNFVAATMQGRGSLERLEITGAGDPSGRGLGFSYLRVPIRPPSSNAFVEKKAAAARIGGAVTGTDADLRRLSMDAACEVLLKFKVPLAQIEKLTRWHRIALVRKLSSEQAASGQRVGAAALSKYARGQRMSFLQLQQQTRGKCQEIWDRQVQSLSAIDGDESESDGEGNGDLDTFAGDLENLLEAEEGDDGDDASKKVKREAMRGLGARRRALQAQREEELEDEEAEAAELRRILMEDDEAEEDKKKRKGTLMAKDKEKESMVAGQDESSLARKKKLGAKTKTILKRIIRTKKPDGTFTTKEEVIKDPKQVALYLEKKNAAKRIQGLDPATHESDLELGKSGLPKKEKKAGLSKNLNKEKLGHMRTNKKKCPLYLGVKDGNLPPPDCAVAEVPLNRPVTKITIQKKKPNELNKDNLAVGAASEAQPPKKNQKAILKIPSIKLKLPSGTRSEADLGNQVDMHPSLDKELDVKCLNGNIQDGSRIVKASKTKSEKQLKKKAASMKENGENVNKLKIRVRNAVDARTTAPLNPILRIVKEKSRQKIESCRDMVENAVEQLETEEEIAYRERNLEHMEAEQLERVFARKKERQQKSREKQREEERQREMNRLEEEKKRRKLEKKRQRERMRVLEQDRLREEERERQRELERIREEEERREREREAERLRQEEEINRLEAERVRKEQERKERERLKHEKHTRLREEEERQRQLVQKGKAHRIKEKDKKVFEMETSRPSKRRSHADSGGSLEIADYNHPPKRQRKRGGDVELSNILESILDTLRRADIAALFLKPVTKKEAPDYLKFIDTPMDLSTIREKVRNLRYKSRLDFRSDMLQIVDNAHIYNNGRNPGIPPLADSLLEMCDELLEERDLELTEVEAEVRKAVEEDLYSARVPPPRERRRSLRTL
ncbi:hypothetical protein O6H91_01G053900 [Diphasiastrum complanatum]|uniref:Uncharacterized protein n=1 Tax=Diphasiastrum complanatum TaxID=34168 RepID=A0ACC2ERE3_DIPCM|nr:hypothetical protein O6H91_01G053900 [Diphasiastrum complanatum]